MVKYKYYFITGTIMNFDSGRPKQIRKFEIDSLEGAEMIFKRLYSGTIWGIEQKGNWKVVKRKKKI